MANGILLPLPSTFNPSEAAKDSATRESLDTWGFQRRVSRPVDSRVKMEAAQTALVRAHYCPKDETSNGLEYPELGYKLLMNECTEYEATEMYSALLEKAHNARDSLLT